MVEGDPPKELTSGRPHTCAWQHEHDKRLADRRRVAEKVRDALLDQKRINNALRNCIDAHGPITKEWVSSASKRIIGQIRKYDLGVILEEERPTPARPIMPGREGGER
jgi:hypothetical protein